MSRLYNLFILCFVTFSISSCGNINHEVRLSDTDVSVRTRYFSPDSSKLLLDYQYWRGNNQDWGMAILNVSDTVGVISKFNLPSYGKFATNDMRPIEWISSDVFLMEMDATLDYRSGKMFKEFTFKKNKTTFNVVEKDKLGGVPQSIEHFAFSPNHCKLLVAYRNGYSAVNIDLSVIDFKGPLQAYGNIFTYYQGEASPILFAKWTSNESILLTKDSSWPLHLTKSSISENIKIASVDDPIKSGWYHEELFPKQDSLAYFGKNTEIIRGIITSKHTWGDSFNRGLVNIEYEYRYKSKLLRSYFRTKKEDRIALGDSINILVNISQPIIHLPLKNDGRYERY